MRKALTFIAFEHVYQTHVVRTSAEQVAKVKTGAGGGTCVSSFSKMQRPEICRCACVELDTINQHGNRREYNL